MVVELAQQDRAIVKTGRKPNTKPAALACVALAVLAPPSPEGPAQHIDGERRLSVALVEQPFVSNGASAGPTTMAAAIGFAAIPPADPGGLSIAALNRLILGAVRGLAARATPIIPGRF